MQAHGAGIIKVDKSYYMIGEDKTNGTNFLNINCYSSSNLVEWTYVGPLLSKTYSNSDLGDDRIVERPKVLYNSVTKKYIMYMHIDDLSYSEAKVGVASADTVCGQYAYHGSFQPQGHQSRDIGLFQDDDGTAYLLSEDRSVFALRIYKLSDDYLSVLECIWTYSDDIEAPALIKRNGVYFMFGSTLSGWSPNDNLYSTATSLAGPWSDWQIFAPKGSNTFDSQTTYVLSISDNLVIYMGDRWVQPPMLITSTYIWLPLTFNGTDVSMNTYMDHWALDEAAGVWAPGPWESVYEGQNAMLSSGAKVLNCSGCMNQKSAGYIGGPQNGCATFSNILATGDGPRLLRIFSPNGDSTQRFANVIVNGGQPTRVAFLPSANAWTPGVSSVMVNLTNGMNEIKIEGVDGGWGPDLDRLQIPES
jgi:hypothetical protein